MCSAVHMATVSGSQPAPLVADEMLTSGRLPFPSGSPNGMYTVWSVEKKKEATIDPTVELSAYLQVAFVGSGIADTRDCEAPAQAGPRRSLPGV